MTTHHETANDAAMLSLEAIGLDRVPVMALEGEEEIGRTPRFEITFAGPEIDAAERARDREHDAAAAEDRRAEEVRRRGEARAAVIEREAEIAAEQGDEEESR